MCLHCQWCYPQNTQQPNNQKCDHLASSPHSAQVQRKERKLHATVPVGPPKRGNSATPVLLDRAARQQLQTWQATRRCPDPPIGYPFSHDAYPGTHRPPGSAPELTNTAIRLAWHQAATWLCAGARQLTSLCLSPPSQEPDTTPPPPCMTAVEMPGTEHNPAPRTQNNSAGNRNNRSTNSCYSTAYSNAD